MEYPKYTYPILAAYVFAILFMLGHLSTGLGIIIGLVIGYLFYRIVDLHTQVQTLQHLLQNPKTTIVTASKTESTNIVTPAKPIITHSRPYTPPTIAPSKADIWLQNFVIAGVILLLIGYFSPIPPKKASEYQS